MTLILTAGPAEEPVTLAEAKAFLRLDGTEEDALVTALVTAARATLEAETRRAFVTQSWRLTLDRWPGREIALPLAPVESIDAITVQVEGGTEAPDASSYVADLAHEPPRLVVKRGVRMPTPEPDAAGIAIDFTAGHGGAADVPEPLRQAVLMLVAHWFETRSPVGFDVSATEIPMMVAALLAPYRRMRL